MMNTEEGIFALIAGLGIGFAIFTIVCVIAIVIAQALIFQKANEPGWHAIVPFLNSYKLYKIIFGNGWYFLIPVVLGLIPIVKVFAPALFSIYTFYKLAKCFNKGTGFAVGLVLLSPVFLIILGFSDDRYYGPQSLI